MTSKIAIGRGNFAIALILIRILPTIPAINFVADLYASKPLKVCVVRIN
jgi:hypothetical protein